MNARAFDYATRKAISDCAGRCELSLKVAARNDVLGNAAAAADWRDRATWWAEQAFREVDAALAARALDAFEVAA